jgi:preprotein translocase subunit SecD
MRWAGLVLLLAGPALSDPALISFEAGHETIHVTGEDIERVETTLDPGGGPAITVRLHSSFDARFADVTQRNIGNAMAVRICGEIVAEPILMSALTHADFIITTGSVEDSIHLAEQLKTRTCPDQPLG